LNAVTYAIDEQQLAVDVNPRSERVKNYVCRNSCVDLLLTRRPCALPPGLEPREFLCDERAPHA
jgi:hypothetical protein